MKTRKLLHILLLIAMHFSMLHAFTISFLDEDHCSVESYVQEINTISTHELSGDICDIHHAFHVPFLLPELELFLAQSIESETPLADVSTHDFTTPQRFLKPPITL